MTPAAIVPDASVAMKWFLAEPGWEAARRWRDAPGRLHVPDLWYLEIATALWKRARRGESGFDAGRVRRLFLGLRTVDVQAHRGAALAERSVEIALEAGTSVYDASYAAVTELARATFVTADDVLYRRLLAWRPAFPVELLAAD